MAKLLPIQLAARQGAWQRFNSRKQNKKFQSAMKKVFHRDQHTCRFCGFRSEKHQHVVNIDQNYANNKGSNLATACPFCAQCFFLDSLAMDENFGGIIIYLPELSQADLNNLCRVIFCVLGKDSPYKSHMQAMYLSLKDRSQMVEKTFGPKTFEPTSFGQALLDCGVPPSHMVTEPMDALRLLPLRKPFKDQIAYWNQHIYSRFPL